jgi:DNA-binding response OmpR family regulator
MHTARSLCILVAEDHEDSLAVLALLLRRNGHTVYTARTADEARDLAAANRCDLLIGDIGLPDRSGIELMRELHEMYGLKGIAVSGYAGRNDVSEALEAGYDMHLAKPLAFPDLLAAIDEVTR